MWPEARLRAMLTSYLSATHKRSLGGAEVTSRSSNLNEASATSKTDWAAGSQAVALAHSATAQQLTFSSLRRPIIQAKVPPVKSMNEA
jgi:hypothetical protein